MTTPAGTPPEMTPAEQGVFYEFFKNNAPPDWFMQSTAFQRRELYSKLIASFSSRKDTLAVLAKLQDHRTFVSHLLGKALSEKLKEPLDITGAVFQHIRSTSSLLGLRKKLVLPIDRDLLTAACENFASGEIEADNYHSDSLIYLPERVTGHGNRILPLKPHEFAALCRQLDFGKRYQEHLQAVLESDAQAQKTCIANSRRNFEMDLHLARMKQHLSEDMHQHLLDVLGQSAPDGFKQGTFSLQTLQLLDCTVYGVLVFELNTDKRCVLYIPGDEEESLKEFATFHDMEVALSKRLRKKAFSDYFGRFIVLGERVGFSNNLQKKLLEPSGGSPLPTSTLYLPLVAETLPGDGFHGLFLHRLKLVKATARLLVVPTDDEDEEERLKRIETYKTVGINLALFAASFIPGIGEILMGVTAFQLLQGVYLGIDSWARGDQEEATEYFFDTTENLILALALAGGQKATTAAYRIVKGSGFVSRLRQVNLSGGRSRLWNPDLAPYRQSMTLPVWLKPDARGLRELASQAYLKVGSWIYAVREQTDTEMWKVQGSSSFREEYSPLLETNDLGAWRHDSELPQEWDRLTLFRRLGYPESLMDDARALEVLTVSGIKEDVLRQTMMDLSTPPAVLVDTVQRFKAESEVNAFIEQLKSQQNAVKADAEMQLYVLTTLSRWPADVALSMTDKSGNALRIFNPVGKVQRTLKLSLDALGKDRLYTEVLVGLTESERVHLLSTTGKAGTQAERLSRVLLEQAQRKTSALFEQINERGNAMLDQEQAVLALAFPKLPVSVVQELTLHAETHELLELEAGNVPLRLAEEARRYLQVIRENRAFEGLYLNTSGSTDTNRLVLDALAQLPGWKGGVYVQFLDWNVSDDTFTELGTNDAEEHLQINAQTDAYQVMDKQYNQLAYLPGRTCENYFRALWEGLSQERRKALGVEVEGGATVLQQKIRIMALRRREFAQQTLNNLPPHAIYTSPMRLADRESSQYWQPISEAGGHTSSILQQRAEALYPAHSREKIDNLLHSFGSDEVLVLRKLERLRIELFELRDTLQKWILRDSWFQAGNGPRVKVRRVAKARAAIQIMRCWRRETAQIRLADEVMHELSLPAVTLGELPFLIADFSHVGKLKLDRIGVDAKVSQFLAGFPQLRELSLMGNELERVPAAISDMKRLESLYLNENRIHLSTQSVAQLAAMTSLKRLELSFNSELGLTPDVSRLSSLEYLGLRETGIRVWPAGTSGLAQLRSLDLRDNRIENIPQEVLVSSDLLNLGTDIRGNPLSTDSVTRLLAYQRQNEIGSGLVFAGQSPSATALIDESMSSIWLTGVTAELVISRRELWRSLFRQPDSHRFFSLLVRMRFTVDYRLAFPSLRERVWGIIESAGQNSTLRRSLFRMAQADARSIDDCTLLFSDMALTALCFKALLAARTTGHSLERQFVRMLRSLFRLREVERFAQKHILTRQKTETVTTEQANQIGFAFRLGLAERLDLLGQPTAVNDRLDVEVTTAILDQAYREVVTLEKGKAIVDWLMANEVWVEYLQNAYREEFSEIEVLTKLQLLELDRQTLLTRDQSTAQMKTIVANNTNAQRSLFIRLTNEALERFNAHATPVEVPSFEVEK